MKKLLLTTLSLLSLSNYAAYEPILDGTISIDAGQKANSVSINLSGDQARRIYEILGTSLGSTETVESWGIIRTSGSKEVSCAKSKDPAGDDFYNCGWGNFL